MNSGALRRSSLLAAWGLAILLAPTCARALTATAGWTRADVGLRDEGDGIYLGARQAVPWASPVFDFSYGLEYVQKKGSQPTLFSDPTAGFTTADAAVTLHVLEPSIFLGARVPHLGLAPRVYVGGAIGLKVKESWSDFPGTPAREYGYKDSDLILHLGATVRLGAVTLDARWSRSLVGQLLVDTRQAVPGAANKVADPLAGGREPVAGFDVEVVRLGLAVDF